jgi:putative colanic acid biosysnthesis UDP-glucose lipid carrier transferase
MSPQRSTGLIRPHHSTLSSIARVYDSGLILGSLYLCMRQYDLDMTMQYLLPCLMCIALFGIFAEYNDIYQGWRGAPMFDEALRILFSWLAAFVIIATSIFIYGDPTIYQEEIIQLWLPLAPISIILSYTLKRGLFAALRKRGFNSRTYAILGANALGKRLENAISQMPWLGYRFTGYYEDRSTTQASRFIDVDVSSVKIVGPFKNLLRDVKARKIDHVYITLPLGAEKRITEMILELADSTVSVNIVPDFFTFNLIQSKWTNVQGIPVVSVFDTPFSEFNGLLKRIEDLLLCAVILPLISIPMLLIGIGVKLTSPGPAIFKQMRYGINGEKIEVWKFRSMTVTENGHAVKQATKNDARVTAFGAFLRRSSLDELPQFINVLQGHMSVVGPRPHAVAHNEEYRKQIQGYMLRHKVKPGITGQAQINGCRGETQTLDKMEARIHHDLEYIKKWSLWLDIKIIFMTIIKGFYSNQAY